MSQLLQFPAPGSAIASAPSSKTAIEGKGCIEKIGIETKEHYMPSIPRLTQAGELLWAPTAVADTNFVGFTSDYSMRQKESLELAVAGFSSITWDGLNIAVPADGLMQMLMHITRYGMGALKIELTNANGSKISYEYKNSFYDVGQKTFQIWDPATDADYVLSGSNTEVVQTGNFFDGSALVKIYLVWGQAFGGATGNPIYLDGLYTQTKIKPMICQTADVANVNVFNNFCPIWKEKGWSAGLRMGGSPDNWSMYTSYLKQAYLDGFDIYNGSLERLPAVTTEAETISEMGVSNTQIKANGFPAPILYSSKGNNLPPKDFKEAVAADYGIRWAKAPNSYYVANVVGPNGLDAPLYTHVTGGKSYNDFVNQANGIIYIGGFMMYFWHECVDFYESDGVTLSSQAQSEGKSAGDELTTNSSASGGSVWSETMQAYADWLETKVAAGEVEVVGVTQLDSAMRGLS